MDTRAPVATRPTGMCRARLLAAAEGVFAVKGYEQASMDDVRLAARCSKGGLYHHFGSKGALLAGVIGQLVDQGRLRSTAPPGLLLDIWRAGARRAEVAETLRAEAVSNERPTLETVMAAGRVIAQIRFAVMQDPEQGEGGRAAA